MGATMDTKSVLAFATAFCAIGAAFAALPGPPPVVDHVMFDLGTQHVIIIGRNFESSGPLRLGLRGLAEMRLIDHSDTVIRALLPADTKPGRYLLWMVYGANDHYQAFWISLGVEGPGAPQAPSHDAREGGYSRSATVRKWWPTIASSIAARNFAGRVRSVDQKSRQNARRPRERRPSVQSDTANARRSE
jgi:hypothetical protein